MNWIWRIVASIALTLALSIFDTFTFGIFGGGSRTIYERKRLAAGIA